jgi:hypothetical protein
MEEEEDDDQDEDEEDETLVGCLLLANSLCGNEACLQKRDGTEISKKRKDSDTRENRIPRRRAEAEERGMMEGEGEGVIDYLAGTEEEARRELTVHNLCIIHM